MSSQGQRGAVRQVDISRSQALQELRRVVQSPRFISIAGIWVFGLLIMFGALPAPSPITDAKMAGYESKLKEADAGSAARGAANRRWQDAQLDTYNQKSWFWWFSSEARQRVNAAKQREKTAATAARRHNKQHEQLLSDAKAQLGLFSEVGVGEGRRLFWSSFEAGKVFGRRQTFFDSLFALLGGGQDRNLAGALVQLIVTAVINFTAGAVLSIFVFLASLPSLVWSYQAGLFSGLCYVLVATVAALSVISSFLALLYGAGAGAVYGIASTLGQPRIGGPRQRTYRMGYQRPRPHFA